MGKMPKTTKTQGSQAGDQDTQQRRYKSHPESGTANRESN